MALTSLPRNYFRIRHAAQMKYSPLSLGELMRRSTPSDENLLEACCLLHRQLPVRYARRIEDFLRLPYVVASNPGFNAVLNSHVDTFNAISDFPQITTLEQTAEFRQLLARQLQTRPCTRNLANGYKQVLKMFPDVRLDTFLHDLFTSTIACRILMEHCVFLDQPREGFAGVVGQNLSPVDIIGQMSEELTSLTAQVYGASPQVEFRGDLDCTLDYIPRHATYMFQEVLKNALCSTVERHLHSDSLPPVVVEFQKGDVLLTIKVSDQGGGMSKEAQKEAWQYGRTSATSEQIHARGGLEAMAPGGSLALAGFGFGLPLTRLHAQFFCGDVCMQSMPGHGTDMYLLMTHLEEGSATTEVDDRVGKAAALSGVPPIHDHDAIRAAPCLDVDPERSDTYGRRGVPPFQFQQQSARRAMRAPM